MKHFNSGQKIEAVKKVVKMDARSKRLICYYFDKYFDRMTMSKKVYNMLLLSIKKVWICIISFNVYNIHILPFIYIVVKGNVIVVEGNVHDDWDR